MDQAILFDLDGTLTDPGMGITNSVIYALKQMGLPVPSRESLYSFIGPPLYESFQNYFSMDPAQADEAVRLFRLYFADHGIWETEVYPGIPEMLSALQKQGKTMILATSKPEKWARMIMDHFNLTQYVSGIYGSTLTRERNQKGQVIAYALRESGIHPDRAVMVGDRKHDVLGAGENHLPCIGVTFGYGTYEELKHAGAAAIADSVTELKSLLTGDI